MNSEKDVKIQVKKLCQKYGAYYVMPATGGYGRSGVPDFLICAGGHFIGVETKFGANLLTPLQGKELQSIDAAGGDSLMVNETGLEALERVLEYHTRGQRGRA